MPEELDPRTRDVIRESTASGLRQAGSNKALSKALGVDPADSSRVRNGDPAKRSVAALAGELVWRLGINYPRTTPYPLITELLILARKSLMAGAEVVTLEARYRELEKLELELEYEKHRLVRDGAGRMAISDVRERLASAQTELAAMGRELEGRS
jgi:hypothetical protein